MEVLGKLELPSGAAVALLGINPKNRETVIERNIFTIMSNLYHYVYSSISYNIQGLGAAQVSID